jgi:short-subunit dehydrogenase
MVGRGHGRILNVASTAAFQPGPLMAVYYATKAYVLHLSEALAVELAGTGVTVTCLCPGPTRTEFQERAGMSNMLLTSRTLMSPSADVAQAGYDGMKRGKRVVIPGLLNKLLVFGVRLSPRRLPPAIVRQLQERRGKA